MKYVITACLSFIGVYGFARGNGCGYEISAWWAVGWATTTLGIHRFAVWLVKVFGDKK